MLKSYGGKLLSVLFRESIFVWMNYNTKIIYLFYSQMFPSNIFEQFYYLQFYKSCTIYMHNGHLKNAFWINNFNGVIKSVYKIPIQWFWTVYFNDDFAAGKVFLDLCKKGT